MVRAVCSLFFALFALTSTFPHLSFTDTKGDVHSTSKWAGRRAVVLFFVTTDCPLSNGYVPEMNRISHDYGSRNVAFYAVQGDATIPLADVRRHAKEFGYAFPYLVDPPQTLAAFTGATTTPEAAVLSSEGRVLYLGRIDNRLVDFGKQRPKPTEFNLRDALDAILSGKVVPHARTAALGCAIVHLK